MLKLIFIFTLLVLNTVVQITAFDISPLHYKSSTDNKINVLDAKLLHFEALNGVKVSELSGLAYRDGTLFAVGDKGYLYTFSIDIQNSKK